VCQLAPYMGVGWRLLERDLLLLLLLLLLLKILQGSMNDAKIFNC
jgi:hypothetical protein